MRKDDYFLNQIDLLGRVLGKIFSDLLGLKTKGQVIEIEAVSEIFINELDFNLAELMAVPTTKLIDFISEKKKLELYQYEKIADILYIYGEEYEMRDSEKMTKLLERSLVLYQHIKSESSTYSVDRIKRIEKLKSRLS